MDEWTGRQRDGMRYNDELTDKSMQGWMSGWQIDGSVINEKMDRQMVRCIDGCMDGWSTVIFVSPYVSVYQCRNGNAEKRG